MENTFYQSMLAKIPRTRVPIDKTRWMNRFGISVYLTYITIGGCAFFLYGSMRIFNPYLYNPKQKIYKAYPDYVNGTVAFYEKEVDNVIRNL